MPLDLMTLPASEAEKLAYCEGFTGTARLFARLDDLQRALGAATAELTDLQRRVFESDQESETAQIERDMERSRADLAQRNADRMFSALVAISQNTQVSAYVRVLADDTLESLE